MEFNVQLKLFSDSRNSTIIQLRYTTKPKYNRKKSHWKTSQVSAQCKKKCFNGRWSFLLQWEITVL